jgi:hypothetical protein
MARLADYCYTGHIFSHSSISFIANNLLNLFQALCKKWINKLLAFLPDAWNARFGIAFTGSII